MNYLSHYFLNHRVRGLEAEPHFVMGVALPDLWPRFSRSRRIRWKHVAAFETDGGVQAGLRDGLLNHAEADRLFHGLPVFHAWQRAVRANVETDGLSAAIADFLAHIAIELALDAALLRAEPALAEEFYRRLEACEITAVETHAGLVADVDPRGLGEVIRAFLQRRFLRQYTRAAGQVEVIRRVLSLTTIPTLPPTALIAEFVEHARPVSDPAVVWQALTPTRD